jgi:hypothetical protein
MSTESDNMAEKMDKKTKTKEIPTKETAHTREASEVQLRAEVIRLREGTRKSEERYWKLEEQREVLSEDLRKLREQLREVREELKREKEHVDVLMKGFKHSLSHPYFSYSNNLR